MSDVPTLQQSLVCQKWELVIQCDVMLLQKKHGSSASSATFGCRQHTYQAKQIIIEADEESRRENRDTEWMLNPDILYDALDRLDVKPEIDLFASRLNRQFLRYVSYKPDLDAEAVNAFTMSWSDVIFCAFPPFCIIPSVLQKNHQGQNKRDTGRPRLAQSAVVPNIGKGTNAETRPRVTERESTCLANKPGSKTQTAEGSTFDYMRSIRKRLRISGFSQTASSVICSSWHSGTSRQYATYIARWKRYANK